MEIMELIEMEFTFFNKVKWCEETVEITTNSRISCIREFIKYVCYSDDYMWSDERRYLKEVFSNATFETIQLPIIKTK